MRVIRNSILPFGSRYGAINLFGVLFAKREMLLSAEVMNHEGIHTAQMRELLYVPFYLLYVIEWGIRLCGEVVRNLKGAHHRSAGEVIFRAYRDISFERESYNCQSDLQYLVKRRCFSQWRKVKH